MKREPIKIPGTSAELLNRTEAHNHVIDNDWHFIVLENRLHQEYRSAAVHNVVFQIFDETGEVGSPYLLSSSIGHPTEWPEEVWCEPVRAKATLVFVPDWGAEV